MKRIAQIRLQYDPKTLWFDPGDLDIHAGDAVIVNTARGLEFGTAATAIIEVDDERICCLKSPLKPIERIATDEDLAQRDEMKRLSDEALPIFKELAAETNEAMRPVLVEYLFDGTKAIFLFEAEERIDFRELVRKLTNRLHVRVDMRQIGVRDEARIIGGLGHCGQELCCRRLGDGFNPVSIRMAKAQDLSLNPASISGVCGRLMCCLRYEYETYKDFKARAPKQNATIATPEGEFKVCELDTPNETVVLRIDRNKKVRIPLSAFDQPEEGAESQRPKSIGDAYYDYANTDPLGSGFTASLAATDRFTGEDKLAEKGAVRHNPQLKRESSEEPDEKAPRGRRRRSRSGQKSRSGEAPKQRAQKRSDGTTEASGEKGKEAGSTRRRRRRSGAKGAGAQQARTSGRSASPEAGAKQKQAEGTAPTQATHRRTRRRSHKTGGASTDGS